MQLLVVSVVLVSALALAVRRVYRLFSRKADPCEGCQGCSLREKTKKDCCGHKK